MSDDTPTAPEQPVAEPADKAPFDPSKYLTKVSGADYLEVKWRLAWFRHDHPDGIIETQLMEHHDQVAIFKAQVATHEGGRATGWGTETYGDFRDYVEKAETKALGRALAAMGYGTQFTPDYEPGIVDSPGSSPQQRGSYQGGQGQQSYQQRGDETFLTLQQLTGGPKQMTPRQVPLVENIMKYNGISPDEMDAWWHTTSNGHGDWRQMNIKAASLLIDHLKAQEAAGVKGTAMLPVRDTPPQGGAPKPAVPSPPQDASPKAAAMLRAFGLDKGHAVQQKFMADRVREASQSREAWDRLTQAVIWLCGPDAPKQGTSPTWRVTALLAAAPDAQWLYDSARVLAEANLYDEPASIVYDERMAALNTDAGPNDPNDLSYPDNDVPY